MARIERQTKRYPTDLTDKEWERIAPLLPGACITGHQRPTSGGVRFRGRSLVGMAPYRIVRLGVARSFQRGLLKKPHISDSLCLSVVERLRCWGGKSGVSWSFSSPGRCGI
jgi:hypothetical protein